MGKESEKLNKPSYTRGMFLYGISFIIVFMISVMILSIIFNFFELDSRYKTISALIISSLIVYGYFHGY